MLTQSSYLDWISGAYPKVQHNLAASGIPALSTQEMRQIEPCWDNDPVRGLAAALAAGLALPAAEVLPCNGASQALWLAYVATLGSGDEVLIESPTYAPFADAALTVGARVRRFERDALEGYAIDTTTVLRRLTPTTRVVAMSHLHNPSGRRADPHAIAVLAETLARQRGYVIVNEIYAPFDQCSISGPSLRSYRAIGPNVVCVGSLSKAFGLGPERIGWLAGPRAVVSRATAAQLASTGDMPRSWAAAALGALEHLPRLALRAQQLVKGNRERVLLWLRERPQLGWSNPEGGLFGLVRLPGDIDSRVFVEAAMTLRGVIVAPGEFFDAPSTFRLAWACPGAQLEPGLCALGEVLSEFGITAH